MIKNKNEVERITLTFSKQTIKDLRLMAVLKGTSLSSLAEELLLKGGLKECFHQALLSLESVGDKDIVADPMTQHIDKQVVAIPNSQPSASTEDDPYGEEASGVKYSLPKKEDSDIPW